MENDQTNSLTARAPLAVTATVAGGATALAVLTQVFGSSTLSSNVTVVLMLGALWGGLLFDVYTRSRSRRGHPKRTQRPIDRPSHAPRLSYI